MLGSRALNRATLDRQLLLNRSDRSVSQTIAHLVGMQAQVPLNPYIGLWSRLERFDPDELGRLLVDREVVRIVAMRATLHLVTADDCLLLRPLMQPALDAELARHRDHGPALDGVDLAPVLAHARTFLAERARTGTELRDEFAARFPDLDAPALAYACRNLLAFVQVPPRGVWGRTAQVTSTTAETWLGRELIRKPSIDEVVLRYLGAFGPATVADVSSWSRLTGMREVVERLRPQGTVLHDGTVAGTWHIERDRANGTATLVVMHAGLTTRPLASVASEGRRFVRFHEAGAASHDIRLTPVENT